MFLLSTPRPSRDEVAKRVLGVEPCPSFRISGLTDSGLYRASLGRSCKPYCCLVTAAPRDSQSADMREAPGHVCARVLCVFPARYAPPSLGMTRENLSTL
jgi:hypothetical protein